MLNGTWNNLADQIETYLEKINKETFLKRFKTQK